MHDEAPSSAFVYDPAVQGKQRLSELWRASSTFLLSLRKVNSLQFPQTAAAEELQRPLPHTSQVEADIADVDDEKRPATQAVQDDAFVLLQVPATQLKQVAEDFAPRAAEEVPASHDVQALEPSEVE